MSGRGKAPGKGPGKPRTGSRPPPVDLGRERRTRGLVAELRALLDAGEVDTGRTSAMLSGDLETARMEDTPTTIRAPRALLDRAEALAAALPSQPSRSAVLRLALARGIAVLEAEALVAPLAPDLAADVADLRRRVAALEGAR